MSKVDTVFAIFYQAIVSFKKKKIKLYIVTHSCYLFFFLHKTRNIIIYIVTYIFILDNAAIEEASEINTSGQKRKREPKDLAKKKKFTKKSPHASTTSEFSLFQIYFLPF